MQNNEAKQPNVKKVIITLLIIVMVISGMLFLVIQLLGNLSLHTPPVH